MSRVNLYSGKRFRAALKHFLLGRTAQAIAYFALTLWLVRLLAPADYGAYMVLWGMVEMMVPLSSLGMMDAVRRFLPELATHGAPGVLSRFVRWMTWIRLTIMVAWAAIVAHFWLDISAWLGFSVDQQDVTWPAVGLIITVIGFRYASEMLESLLEQRWSQLTHALMPIGRLTGVAILVSLDALTLGRIIWIDLIVSLSCFLLTEFFLMRKLRSLPGTGDYRVGVMEIINFAWHMAGVNLLRVIASAGAVRILVARTLGLEMAGMFAFLQQLLIITGRYLPAKLLVSLIRPVLISRYVAGDTHIVSQGVALLWKINLLIIVICIAIMSIAGDSVISLISGGRFNEAGMIMLIMLFGLGAASQGQLINMAMQIFSYTRQLKYFSLLSILTPIAVIAGAYWGLAGVATGIALSVWILNSVTLYWLNRQGERIELDFRGFSRGLILAIVLVVAGWMVEPQLGPWWTLALMVCVYLPGLMLVKPLNTEDSQLLRRGLSKRARYFDIFVKKS